MSTSPIQRERLLACFLELTQINSPSRHEGPMARHVAGLLAALGAEIEYDDAHLKLGSETGNIIARVAGTVAAPPLLFCAHLDTVEPTERLVVQRQDGKLRSDGTTILGADDKAGVAAILEMLRAVRDSGIACPPLELVFTVAEEVGLMGSQMLDCAALTAKIGFVPDASGEVGLIVTRAPAQKHLQIAIRGKAAHAGMAPELGISAITVAARAIANLPQGRIDEETTSNIGTIHGGKATNIVPDLVEIEGEARSRDPWKLANLVTEMSEAFLAAAERAHAEVDIKVTDVYPAFNLHTASRAVRLAYDAAVARGIAPAVTATGGGSDANFFNQGGIETVILSTGYQNPHSVEEVQDEGQLVQLAEWLYEIVWSAGEEG